MAIYGSSLCIDGEKKDAFSLNDIGVQAEIVQNGDNYIYRKLVLKNTSDRKSGRVTQPLTLDCVIDCSDKALVHSLRGDNCSKESFNPVNTTLSVGESFVMIPADGRSSDTDAFPFFDVTVDDRTFVFGIGWTGMWKCEIKREQNFVNVKIGIANADFCILPGEKLSLASVCVVEGEKDEKAGDVRRKFRRVMLKHFNGNPYKDNKLPKALSMFDCYYDWGNPWNDGSKWDEWITYSGQFKSIEAESKIKGLDTYWLDAAWFRDGFKTGVGNFSFIPSFDKGLLPISEKAHATGLKMLLWFEPERLYKNTDVYNAHPEYALPCSTANNQDVFLYNLGNEEAYKYIRDILFKFIKDNGIDIYRQDFNISPVNYWLENDSPDRIGITEIYHINNLYRLWDEMKQEFDGIFIDNCAGGGRRIDLESVKRTCHLWRSDINCLPITNSLPVDVWQQNHLLALTQYLPIHSGGTWDTCANTVRSCATTGINCIYALLKDNFPFDEACAALDEVETLSKYWNGDFYPLTNPTNDNDVFIAYQLDLNGEGYACVFRRENCEQSNFSLKLCDIDVNRDYILTLIDENRNTLEIKACGKELSQGYEVCLPQKRTSLVVMYKLA